uniref:Dual specificity phosphatase 19a n=1 Tax=Pygocentrus nattereri TaxID=42514 RepID=A0AAR2LXJ3_PYGNA
MQSLAQEIKSFSKNNLRKQCTRVTTLSGRRIIETWKGSTVHVVEDTGQSETPCGYVQDNTWDLQVGYIRPYLLVGSQDAAHDFGTLMKYKVPIFSRITMFFVPKPPFQPLCSKFKSSLRLFCRFQVTHILNVAYGVENAFQELFVYKTLSILDQPDTDIISYLQECSQFIDKAKAEKGVVLVHCNAGVSRSVSIITGYLMSREGQSFDDAFSLVKSARPASCPNPGFLEQLKNFKPQSSTQANGLGHA